ncbi:hypothetical protein GW17_00054815 [Ensete ventricosum]|nr:hypothetical protein GW17_00054815 [Ensete ventricosum]
MRGPYKKRAHRLEQEVAAAKKDRDAVEVIEVESSTEKVAPAGEEHGQEVQSGSHVFGERCEAKINFFSWFGNHING